MIGNAHKDNYVLTRHFNKLAHEKNFHPTCEHERWYERAEIQKVKIQHRLTSPTVPVLVFIGINKS